MWELSLLMHSACSMELYEMLERKTSCFHLIYSVSRHVTRADLLLAISVDDTHCLLLVKAHDMYKKYVIALLR